MSYTLDTFIDRHALSDCMKWHKYPDEVIPLWVADMDFRSPEPVLEALHERVDHGIFGYQSDCPELRDILVERLRTHHHLNISTDQIVFMPGLVFGLTMVSRVVGEPGSGVLVNTPVYPPFLSAPKHTDRTLITAPLASSVTDGILRYEVDFDALEAAVTPDTRLFILCNPHNPVGRVYSRAELEGIAEFCLRHDLTLCSDEIHCDLVYPGEAEHISIAALSPEIAAHTVTLLAPSKTFNLPGLYLGFSVIPDADLCAQVNSTVHGMGVHVNNMGYAAAKAAYTLGQPWLDEVLAYLRENRDLVVDFVRENLPGVTVTQPEGTYLGWLDCRALNLEPSPYEYFLDNAKVAFGNGADFAAPGFVRINYGCPRETLLAALDRVKKSL